MTIDEKLDAIFAVIQVDVGNRGLARDPKDNLFTACPGDFTAACRSIAHHPHAAINLTTGFFIPSGDPPAFETDGPLGCAFLMRALAPLGIQVCTGSSTSCAGAIAKALNAVEVFNTGVIDSNNQNPYSVRAYVQNSPWPGRTGTHAVALELAGRASDGRCYSMRGRDVTANSIAFAVNTDANEIVTIGIGDGGNEIGMGKIPHEAIVKNIPNGDLIHCRAATDYLIVAGISNWGAYAIAAALYLLRNEAPPPELFDPDREREILDVMVREGPLVDGVTGQQTATVDGLTWDDYIKPMLEIQRILES